MRTASSRQVLVVEDDVAGASRCRGVVEAIGPMAVAGVVRRAEDALSLLGHHRCDLVLVGVRPSATEGLRLVQRLRTMGHPAEIIVLSDTDDAAAVHRMVQWGALDVLLRPFTAERLRQSLGLFLHRAEALGAARLDQAGVDRLCAAGRATRRSVPKGLSVDGVGRVREALDATSRPLSSASVATTAGFAQVTARRYLEYLVATGQAAVESVPSGPGRPRKLYRRASITAG